MDKIRYILILLFALPLLVHAQESSNELSRLRYAIQTNALASVGKNAPFWLTHNRHGLSSLERNNGNLNVGLYRDFDQRKFAWAYGMQGAFFVSQESQLVTQSPQFIVQQLYGDLRYGCWELSVGSKERWSEGKHRTLSGGGLTFSPNARPIPQVRFGINEYTNVPWWFDGWVHVKGHFSYGAFTDDAYIRVFTSRASAETLYIQDVLFHEKSAFLKIGNPARSPFAFEMGLEMYCQFGGTLYAKDTPQDSLVFALPRSYKEYIKAFIPLAGGADTPMAEQTNVNGNQLGSWHFIASYSTPQLGVRAYCEHFFEDHSQMIGFAFNRDWKGSIQKVSYFPWRDGLLGIEITLPKCRAVRTLLYEYTAMKDQSGPILHNSTSSLTEQVSGYDCYYHHYIYQGWQHWGMGLGTPLATTSAYNENGNPIISSSRIKAHHMGVEGLIKSNFAYRVLGTYVRHWGTYRDPLKEMGYQVSTLFELQYAIPSCRTTCTLSFAKDWSNTIIGNNTGVNISFLYIPTL